MIDDLPHNYTLTKQDILSYLMRRPATSEFQAAQLSWAESLSELLYSIFDPATSGTKHPLNNPLGIFQSIFDYSFDTATYQDNA